MIIRKEAVVKFDQFIQRLFPMGLSAEDRELYWQCFLEGLSIGLGFQADDE